MIFDKKWDLSNWGRVPIFIGRVPKQKLGWLFTFFIRGKDQDIERLKRGGYYEREKQRGKGKQEGAAEKPQREEKGEEGEEEQVGLEEAFGGHLFICREALIERE